MDKTNGVSVLGLLGLEGKLKLNTWQEEIFRQFLEDFKGSSDNAQTLHKYALCGAHGVGKTTLGALIIISHLMLCARCRKEESYRAVVYSGSEKQLKQSLWGEIDLLIQLSPKLQKVLEYTYQKIELRLNRKFAVHARACNLSNIQSLAGVHADNMMIVADEATAISDAAFQKMETFFTSGRAHWLIMANPTTTIGYFYHIFATENSWFKKVITRFDMNEDDIFAKEMEERYGINSDEYRVRVLGQFPQSENRGLIHRYVLDMAKTAERYTTNTSGPYAMFIDVATGEAANFSAFLVRNVLQVLSMYREKIRHDDYFFILKETIDRFARKGLIYVGVDAIGVGFGLYQMLQAAYASNTSVKIVAFIANKPPKNNALNYKDQRTEVYFRALGWLKNVGYLPPDLHLASRLCDECQSVEIEIAPGSGLITLASKRSGDEPRDLADCLAGTFMFEEYLTQVPMRHMTSSLPRAHLTRHSFFAKTSTYIKQNTNSNYE